MQTIQVSTFYRFLDLTQEQVKNLKDWIEREGSGRSIRGLFIIGPEGINTTFSGTPNDIEEFKVAILEYLKLDSTPFKDSFTDRHPFHELTVKVRDEIVTLERPGMVPKGRHNHLSPEEWHRALNEDDVVVIDTRNSYEYEIGHFKKAIDPGTRNFHEFPEYLKKANIPKDKKVLIYCTGGIRCEKAILEMENQGFTNVYQLDGGILNYLKQMPYKDFEGECFVFDYRVAVDQELKPTRKYRLCPHCGQPAATKIDCVQCGIEEIVCDRCLEKGAQETGDIMRNQYRTCSKNCAHHFRMGHKSKRIHVDAFRKRGRTPVVTATINSARVN